MAFTDDPWKSQSDHMGLSQTGAFARREKTHLRLTTLFVLLLLIPHDTWEVWPGGVLGKLYVDPEQLMFSARQNPMVGKSKTVLKGAFENFEDSSIFHFLVRVKMNIWSIQKTV